MKFALALITLAMLCIFALGQDQAKDVDSLIKHLRDNIAQFELMKRKHSERSTIPEP